MKMEQTECSETSALPAYEDGTDRMFRNVGTTCLWRWNRQNVPKRRHLPAYEDGTECSETSTPTCLWRRNRQNVPKRRHLPAYEDGTECSETSAYKIQTPLNYPAESTQHSEHNESLKSRILSECFTPLNYDSVCCIYRLRWSRGSMLAFGTQVSGEKILSAPSFGGEVKPSVPCLRCKRSLNLRGSRNLLPDIFLAHSSTFR